MPSAEYLSNSHIKLPMKINDVGPNPPRILMVVNADWFFLSHRLEVARAARDAGAEVTVVAPDTGKGEAIRREGLGFIPMPLVRSSTNVIREAHTLTFLIGLYRRLRPDLVHHVTFKPVLYGSLAARRVGGIAVVNAVSGLGFIFTLRSRARLLQFLVKRLFKLAMGNQRNIAIFQNPDDMTFFSDMGLMNSKQAVLIRGSGVDCNLFRFVPEPAGDPVVLLPARMLWDKGVGEFVAAAQAIRKSNRNVRFALVGGADSGNRAMVPQQQLEEWSRAGIVEWWGHREDMPAVLAQASIVVLPTYYREGLPKALLEAAATGRALITTDIPGCREIVRPGINGILVPPRDGSALTDAVSYLLRSPQIRQSFGQAGRKIAVAEFGVAGVVEETLQIYRQLLPNRWAPAEDRRPAAAA